MSKIAIFRFEANCSLGAGHAIRTCVIADALTEKGWVCTIVTSSETYEFITELKRFPRIEPASFYNDPTYCDLLIIDHYHSDEKYEKHFRCFSKKIMVIDDLANRTHDCDILLDQTYGRESKEYRRLVPDNCKILTGSDYVLLRKKFIELRPKALEKRRKTKEIKRILVTMGGSDPGGHTLYALKTIKESGFTGVIDIVLGFSSQGKEKIEAYIHEINNECFMHINPDIALLVYRADFAIGAAGSGVWERCCLGLKQLLLMAADNQKENFEAFTALGDTRFLKELLASKSAYQNNDAANIVDGFGVNRVVLAIEDKENLENLHFRKIVQSDRDQVYAWQATTGVRQYCRDTLVPLYADHLMWFSQRLNEHENPYWIICKNSEEIGVLSLTYHSLKSCYELGWFLMPEKWGQGLGAVVVQLMLCIVQPFEIYAYVKEGNIASQKSLEKSGFFKTNSEHYFSKNKSS